MLRTILLAVAVVLVAGSIPASAAKMSRNACRNWCLQNRCMHGAGNQQLCLEHCVPDCVKRHSR